MFQEVERKLQEIGQTSNPKAKVSPSGLQVSIPVPLIPDPNSQAPNPAPLKLKWQMQKELFGFYIRREIEYEEALSLIAQFNLNLDLSWDELNELSKIKTKEEKQWISSTG